MDLGLGAPLDRVVDVDLDPSTSTASSTIHLDHAAPGRGRRTRTLSRRIVEVYV
jgi:hypothetical protein